MLAVSHTVIGIAIGLAIQDPVLAFGAGLVSHHLADAVPHFDPGSFLLKEPWRVRLAREFTRRDWIMVAIDALLTIGVLVAAFFLISPSRLFVVGLAVLGALLPDLIHNIPFWGLRLRKIGWNRVWQDAIHRRFQWTVDASQWHIGIGTQLLTIALCVWYVVSVR